MKNYKKQLSKLRTLPINRNDFSLTQVTELKKGSFFKYKNLLHLVESISIYTDNSGFTWKEFECYCIQEDNIVYFEVEEDDEIEVFVTLKEVSMNQLNKNVNQIEDISENESGSIIVEDIVYEYEDDYKANWRKNDESYKVYFYDFVNKNNKSLFLTVEEWNVAKNEYEYKAYISKKISLNEISIILN